MNFIDKVKEKCYYIKVIKRNKTMKKAFTLAELCTVIVVLGIIAAVIAKITFKTPQGQFDIKYDKTKTGCCENPVSACNNMGGIINVLFA